MRVCLRTCTIQLYDACTTRSHYMLVKELCPVGSLYSFMKENRLTFGQKKRLLLNIAEALQEFWDQTEALETPDVGAYGWDSEAKAYVGLSLKDIMVPPTATTLLTGILGYGRG